MYRLGTTSYILPDDLAANVRFLAGRVQDVELILFDLEGGPSNLPDAAAVDELARLAEGHNLTYTVHLPLDLRLDGRGGFDHPSLLQARRVIECTWALRPWAYVAHLDRGGLPVFASPREQARWEDLAAQALEQVAGWVGDPALLAVENLEGSPPEANLGVLERVPASLCIDIGHLWRDEYDAQSYLEAYLGRARVVHLHGVNERDHASLAHVQPEALRQALAYLKANEASIVLTIEVFNEMDLESSLTALRHAEGEQ
ncbi:MAG: sugar phosphate isomerase/epimerase [Anaerolineae bacterium]|nr:sugar phosphate isomerase/epimerase [Anaerolineae bacterium]